MLDEDQYNVELQEIHLVDYMRITYLSVKVFFLMSRLRILIDIQFHYLHIIEILLWAFIRQNAINFYKFKYYKQKIQQMSSKPTQKFAATFYNQQKKKQPKTPPKIQSSLRKGKVQIKKKISDNQAFQDIALHQKDERFKYLLKHGQLKKIQKNGNIIFAQLAQIPDVWVCYRRPCERQNNLDRLSLDNIELTHVPLLEGEQKLKMLTFQHNQIAKIQNLISLPNLIYIDFFDNQIKEIENLSNGIPTLKVLLLPKNSISKIKNINELVKLQVLDLHSNKITKIQGFGVLNSLRILNLSHNQITKMENIENLLGLTQLNLKSNLIVTIQNIKTLSKLQKLYLSGNRIQIKNFESCEMTRLSSLRQLSLENNPCSKEKVPYFRSIMKHMSFLKLLDGKTPTLMQDHDSAEQDNHAQVLKLIASQWEDEKKRIKSIQQSNGSKREYLKTTLITGGHAQIQDETILFIYGNSYEVVLAEVNFQETVEKIRFQYVFIQFLIEQNILNTLKKFKKLKILEFSQNYIMSLLQIAKLQNLTNLKTICIENKGNPIAACTFLKQFIIYRFPSIVQINREDVKQADRNKAKVLFQNFDKALQIPEKTFGAQSLRNYPCEQANAKKDRNYLKNFNKIINQQCEEYLLKASERAQRYINLKFQAQRVFDEVILQNIKIAQSKVE